MGVLLNKTLMVSNTVHVCTLQVLRSRVWIISDSKMGQVSGSPESQEAIASKSGKLCVLSTCKSLSSHQRRREGLQRS